MCTIINLKFRLISFLSNSDTKHFQVNLRCLTDPFQFNLYLVSGGLKLSRFYICYILHKIHPTMKLFSHKSDSTITNVCPSLCPSVFQSQKPLSLSESLQLTIKPIYHQAYWSSILSNIKPINHWAYQPSNSSTNKPIDHQAYQPLSLQTIEPITQQAYRPLTIKPIDLSSSFTTFKPFGLFEFYITLSNILDHFLTSPPLPTKPDQTKHFQTIQNHARPYLTNQSIPIPPRGASHIKVVSSFLTIHATSSLGRNLDWKSTSRQILLLWDAICWAIL